MTESRHTIETARLRIRLADFDDANDLVDYDRRNTEHLRPWEPTRDSAALDLNARKAALAKDRASADADQSYKFLTRVRDEDGRIVAVATLSNIVRGVFEACNLGYSVDAAFEGKGIAFETVQAVVAFAFGKLRLHRVMANYQPSNARSASLLRRLGFVPEGYARDYLFINAVWRDHILTSLLTPGSD